MNSSTIAVDLDPQAKGLEDCPLHLGIGVGQVCGQVRKRRQDRARVLGVDGGAVASGLIELLENRLLIDGVGRDSGAGEGPRSRSLMRNCRRSRLPVAP